VLAFFAKYMKYEFDRGGVLMQRAVEVLVALAAVTHTRSAINSDEYGIY
jgi:hypothetical protein